MFTRTWYFGRMQNFVANWLVFVVVWSTCFHYVFCIRVAFILCKRFVSKIGAVWIYCIVIGLNFRTNFFCAKINQGRLSALTVSETFSIRSYTCGFWHRQKPLLQKQLRLRYFKVPRVSVKIWWTCMVPCRGTIFSGTVADTFWMSSSVMRYSFILLESLREWKKLFASTISVPVATFASAARLRNPPIPSAAPLPWPASKKFQVTFLKLYSVNSFEQTK